MSAIEEIRKSKHKEMIKQETNEANQDERIKVLKKVIDQDGLERAIKNYKKVLLLMMENNIPIGATSHVEFNKALWISSLEAQIDIDPTLL